MRRTMTQTFLSRFFTICAATLVWGTMISSCQAAKKSLTSHIETTASDGVYSLFNMIFSSNGVWVLLGLAAFVMYLFWRKS